MADASTYTAANTATTQNYMDAINGQLSTLTNPVTANSPVVTSQTDAYRLATERGLADTQRQSAEAAYANGNSNTGGAAESQQAAREAASAAEANNTGNVVATAEAERQSELENLLGLGTSTSLQQQGVTNQSNQFGVTADQNQQQINNQKAQFGVTSAQQQEAIENALKVAQAQNDLGYYNTNTGANLTTRQQDITAAGGLGS